MDRMRIDKGLLLLRLVHDDDGGKKGKAWRRTNATQKGGKVGVLALSPGRKEPCQGSAAGCRLQQFKDGISSIRASTLTSSRAPPVTLCNAASNAGHVQSLYDASTPPGTRKHHNTTHSKNGIFVRYRES
jgi:hypothetical protein